jgi:tetratricopeptide (TPR) repeat protein
MLGRSTFSLCAALTLFFSLSGAASAQTGELRGRVVITQADGSKTPASEAAIDVFRMDLPGKYNTKANKRGEFVFAGLPYVGRYIVAASHPSAQPSWQQNVLAGRGVEYEITLMPGDGKRLTLEEIKSAGQPTGSAGPAGSGSTESAEDRAKREELARKNAEIEEKNKKILAANEIVARTFKAGNEALLAKNYGEALRNYDEGLSADPEQPALLTNKALALKARGVDSYNASITDKEESSKSSKLESAKKDFQAAAEAATKAIDVIKAQQVPTDPAELNRFNANKLSALNTRAEAMRLYVTKVDQSKADDGFTSYEEYIAAEPDATKKANARRDAAQMLFDAGAFEKALTEYQKLLAANPDDPDALVKSGMLLFNIGAMENNKEKYQEAANYLQQFVNKAPDNHAFKDDAKAILEELKNQQNVQAAPTPARGRRRP